MKIIKLKVLAFSFKLLTSFETKKDLKRWFSHCKCLLTDSRMWFCNIILEAAGDKFIFAHLRVEESATPRLAESQSRRLADMPSRGVVFRLWISPQIRSQKRNGSKDSVRDLWGPNFCKNPRKSASLPCPFKTTRNNPTSLNNGQSKIYIYKTFIFKHN